MMKLVFKIPKINLAKSSFFIDYSTNFVLIDESIYLMFILVYF